MFTSVGKPVACSCVSGQQQGECLSCRLDARRTAIILQANVLLLGASTADVKVCAHAARVVGRGRAGEAVGRAQR